VHKLLERQLRRYIGTTEAIPDNWRRFIEAVDTAYHTADQDRLLLERSVELVSEELIGINEKLRANADELTRSNEELEQFAYVASHDLKAPLRAIENLSTWLHEDLGGVAPEGVAEKLALLRGRVRRMIDFIDGLLEYSRAGKTSNRVERVATRALVAEVTTFLAIPDGFSVISHPELPELETAAVPLREVLLNLIGNAVKHHDRPAGTIEVSAMPVGKRYEFRVKDDGPGIDPRFHRRVFQMFQTLKARDQVESTGIGLALVKKIVTAQGGEVSLHSDGKRGTELRFTWPMQWGAR
jgi:light-regulated signal transduction histidine kinase (bacteriophytochrome)